MPDDLPMVQTAEDARRLFSYIDPKLGVPLPEKNYAEDCRLYTPEDPVSNFRNLRNTIYDEFIIAHFLGWFGKAFLFRDMYISWFWSILFEVCELSLAHVLPNFKECWWDQIILDIIVCNGAGIIVGHWVMRWFEMKVRSEYRIFGFSCIEPLFGRPSIGSANPEELDGLGGNSL